MLFPIHLAKSHHLFLVQLFIAGLLESANSSILAAQRFFKEVVGKNQDIYVN